MKENMPFPIVDKAAMSHVAVKLFFAIGKEWNLTDEQRCTLAGLATSSTLDSWRIKIEAEEAIKLPRDTLERLSLIAGIYKALQSLFPEPAQWKEWLHKTNRDFGGRSVLDHMLGGKIIDLADVRRYLDGWCEDNYT